jgi:hypothetical protein
VKNLIDKIMQHKMKILGLIIVVLGLSFFNGNNDDGTLEVSVQKFRPKIFLAKWWQMEF